MSLKALAEAVILQSAEDFMHDIPRAEDVEFFRGEGFQIYSRIAGLDQRTRHTFLNLLRQHLYASAPSFYFENYIFDNTAKRPKLP
jgi:hypothetical protein